MTASVPAPAASATTVAVAAGVPCVTFFAGSYTVTVPVRPSAMGWVGSTMSTWVWAANVAPAAVVRPRSSYSDGFHTTTPVVVLLSFVFTADEDTP